MVFVTGASRSGTTLVTQMLGRHSEIAGLRELQYFGEFCDPRRDEPDTPVDAAEAVARLLDRQNRGILGSRGRPLPDADTQRILDRLPAPAGGADVFAATVATLAARKNKRLPCEQTPRNIYYARALLEWYPNARFLHMVRDPRAVMASQKYRWRRRSLMADASSMTRLQTLRTWVNYHPYTVTQLWTRATLLALELEGHPRFHLLKFEDLILEPERRMREVCEFLGVGFEPEMLDVGHVNSSHVSGSTGQRGLSRGSIDAWREKLSSDEQALAHQRCQPLMERLGYPCEPRPLSRIGALRTGARYLLHVAGAAAVNPRRLWIQGSALLPARRQSLHQAAPRCSHGALANGTHDRHMDHAAARRTDVFGLPCSDVPLECAARHLVESAAAGRVQRVSFVNAHTLNVSVRDRGLHQALRESDVIYADGVGMAVAARLQGRRLLHNVNGTDLFPLLCLEAARRRVPLALFGAAPGVIERCRAAVEAHTPGVEVAWSHHGFVESAQDNERLIEEINRSGARILLVAMGVPRQERWIREHSQRLQVPVVMGVGGLFDFTSGRVPRAPRSLRRLRLEWLFRLMIEPRRLFGRYVLGNPLFLARALRYSLTGHLWDTRSDEAASQ